MVFPFFKIILYSSITYFYYGTEKKADQKAEEKEKKEKNQKKEEKIAHFSFLNLL